MYSGTEGWVEAWVKFLSVPIMGGMVNIINILITIVTYMLMAIPFWLFWTVGRIGAEYFYFLPDVYHYIPWWRCIGLFLCIGIVRVLFINNTRP